ncbi:hypothetical protein [Nitratidesulfovibrio sp. 1201_IL3209]|uniref:hypothetical protein n=1 Tax=Nitratidesulfovibrio sp. 1201_IL3209 TaxID=3084053 RepID=UPI002FD8972D
MSDDADILHSTNQVKDFLVAQGFRVSYGKVRDDIARGALKPRRGGGYTRAAALAYAKANIARRTVDPAPVADAPRGAPVEGGAAERRTSADAELKEIGAMRARFNFAREMGRYTETVTVEAELAARARAFRLGLEKFGSDAATQTAAIFGADGKHAAELARRLGLPDGTDGDAVRIIVDFALSRAPAFTRRWQRQVEGFLDAYATETWWTDEMRDAWDKYQQNKDMEVPSV